MTIPKPEELVLAKALKKLDWKRIAPDAIQARAPSAEMLTMASMYPASTAPTLHSMLEDVAYALNGIRWRAGTHDHYTIMKHADGTCGGITVHGVKNIAELERIAGDFIRDERKISATRRA